MARKFFYVCAGMLMLALSYHLGAGTAVAQAPGNSVVAVMVDYTSSTLAFTANGDVYWNENPRSTAPWHQVAGNVFSGPGPTNVTRESWGDVKARYRTPSGVGRATGR